MHIHPLIYSIVVTFNGMPWIDKCINSLRNNTIPVQIIVIDNASTDLTVSHIRKNYSEVELIESSENVGFGRANNIGIRRALDDGADFIFLLNQDAWIEYNCFEKLVHLQRAQQKYGILSPLHLNGAGDGLDFLFSGYLKENQEVYNDLFAYVPPKCKEVYEVSFANAAMWFISRECLNTVGGFDPLFSHYGEDSDFANRARYHGYKIGICTEAIGWHDRPQVKRHPSLQRTYIDCLIRLKNVLSDVPVPSRWKLTYSIFRDLLEHSVSRALPFPRSLQLKVDIIVYWRILRILPLIAEHRRISTIAGLTFLTPKGKECESHM